MSNERNEMTRADKRMPVAFIPHGGGPWPFVDMGIRDKAGFASLVSYLEQVRAVPQQTPKALLVISAHWEEAVPTVTSSARPPMLYDYYGFPPASYEITWPAPGDPQLASRVQKRLESAGFPSAADPARGFDHGTFIPLKLTYPAADVPTVQLSLKRGLDASEHLAIGRALEPLRHEGIFIVGSGMTFHDLRTMFSPSARNISETFDAWLRETTTAEPKERDARLAQWTNAPSARQAHPREEHLLPLMVVAGAAGEDRATVAYNDTFMGVKLSAYHFG
jgi:aromatic ring-opening dioxygenase catalytic subunit (LigB family)